EFSRDLVDTTATTVCSARSHEAAGEPGVRAALVTDPEVRELSMVPVGRRTTCGVRPAPWGSAGRTVTWENVTGDVSSCLVGLRLLSPVSRGCADWLSQHLEMTGQRCIPRARPGPSPARPEKFWTYSAVHIPVQRPDSDVQSNYRVSTGCRLCG